MFCTGCGQKNEQGGKYCPYCGRKLLKKRIINLSPVGEIFKKTEAHYRRHVLPHHDKIAKYLPMVSEVFAAVLLMINIIIPAYGRKMYDMGKEYIAQMQYGEAVAAFSQAGMAGVSDNQMGLYMGQAYIGLENYDKAKEILTEEGEKTSPERLKLLAEVWRQENNSIMYEATLNELIALAPNDPEGYLKLSEYYREEGLYDNASGILEKLLKRQKNSIASAMLYNIYMESYLNTASAEKGANIKDEAMKALSSAKIESLNINDKTALSLSPKGRFAAIESAEKSHAVDIYELDGSAFMYHSTFVIPAGYVIDSGMIAWNSDETMLAFYNANGEEFIHDSSIYVYDIPNQELKNLTDPKEDYIHYMVDKEIYLIDSLPCFSEDSKSIYFARKSVKGNWLCSVNINGENLTHLFEPADGGWVDYKIIERGRIYFSVRGHEKSDTWGIYAYDEANGARRLKFDYDSRYYHLALKDITADGRYLLYYLTVSSQNNSMFFGILDLENMKLTDVYTQDIDSYENKLSALNRSNIFGASRMFITRNAAFSSDGKSIYIAEDGAEAYGKLIRRFPLSGGSGDFVYISFEKEGAKGFCIPTGENKSGVWFAEISAGKFLITDKGLRLLSVNEQ